MSRRSSAKKKSPAPSRPAFRWHASPAASPAEDRALTLAAWVLAAALAALLLALDLGPHRIGDYFTETDFYGAYADGARLIQHGHLVAARYAVIGPVYEALLAVTGFAIRDLFAAANTLSLAATVGSLLLCFHLLRKRAGARLGLLTCLLLAANPFFLRYGYAATTDAPAMCLQMGALYLLLAGESLPSALWAGVLAALAFLTRYNAVVLLPAGIAAIALGGTRRAGRARAAGAFALGFLLPVVPWVLYSLSSGSRFRFALHHNIAYEVFARSHGITWDDYQEKMESQFPTLASVIAKDPAAVLGRLWFNLWDHLRLDAKNLLGWPVAASAAVGAVFAGRDARLRGLWPLWLAAVLLYLTLVPAGYSERYSMPLLPMYLALAAAAFASPLLGVPVGRAGVPAKALLVAVPLVFSVIHSVRAQSRFIQQFPADVLPCARALRGMARPGDKIIARKGHIGFHSGTLVVPFPYTHTWKELGDFAHREGVRWLYLSWPEAETRPEYAVLLDTTAGVPGLTLRYATFHPPALLYEIGPRFGENPPWQDQTVERIRHEALARLQIATEDPQALQMLGRVANARGELPAAREYLSRSVLTGPREALTWSLLGDVCAKQGDGPGASAAYGHAAELSPRDPTLRIKLGWAAEMMGQPQQAAAYWRPLVSNVADPEILTHMLRVFTTVGDAGAAEIARKNLVRAAARK